MKKLNFYKTIVLLTCCFFSSAYARECSVSERDKAEYFAEKAGNEIISKYGGGQDKRTNVSSCSYNSYSKIFSLDISVYWNGSMIRENHYNVDGVLKLNANGTPVNFSQTYANENVEDLSLFYSFIEFAVMAEELSAENGYRIHFTNECGEKLELAISYKDISKGWLSVGWWEFAPHKGAYLQAGDKFLRTNSAVLYYYVKPSASSSLQFDGSYPKKVDGVTYYMKKIEDKSGETRWSVTCAASKI